MNEKQNLFSDFPTISRAAWLEKIEKDLKGKPLEDLFWQLEENIRLSPVYHPDDEISPVNSIQQHKPDNDWEIGGYIRVVEPTEANAEMLEGLQGGLMAVQLNIEKVLSHSDLERLFEQVETDFISTHFSFSGNPLDLFRSFEELLKNRGKAFADTNGSLCFDPFENEMGSIDLAQTLLNDYATDFTAFKFIQLQTPAFTGIENSSSDLAQVLAKASDLFSKMDKEGIAPATTARHLKLSLSVGTNFFVEMAKLRALNLLWANLLAAYKIDNQKPEIEVHFAENCQKEDGNYNMIQASTQAMAAVLGGAHRLYVPPSGSEKGEISFQNRIARNVQHILKMESYLDRVVDPAAGSYYIEKLTEQLAKAAWTKFREIESKGGYEKVF